MTSSLVDRVRIVIEQVADSHTAFGSLVGISKDKLSKSLAGSRRFTSLELALIAEAGGVSVDWLLTGKAPARPSIAARTLDGATLDTSSITELVDRHMAAFDVLDLLGERSTTVPLTSINAELTLTEQGEALAAYAVQVMSVAGYSIRALNMTILTSAIEDLFGTDIAIMKLPAGLDGLAWQRDGDRLIFLAPTKQWTRQRFTLAHELGHVLAGDAQQILVDQHLSPGLDHQPTEVRANSFAAAFLMPAGEIHDAITHEIDRELFARLVVSFKVSSSAMAVRLRSLSYLNDALFHQLRRMTSLECYELAGDLEAYVEYVNDAIGSRLPSRLVKALFTAYREGRTTLRPLANLLDVDVNDLNQALSGIPDETATESQGELVYSL